MQGKKWIAAALVCGFLLGQGTAPAQAGILGTVVKAAPYRYWSASLPTS